VPNTRPVSASVTVRVTPGASEPSEQFGWPPAVSVQLPPAALIDSRVEPAGIWKLTEARSAVRVPTERTVNVSE